MFQIITQPILVTPLFRCIDRLDDTLGCTPADPRVPDVPALSFASLTFAVSLAFGSLSGSITFFSLFFFNCSSLLFFVCSFSVALCFFSEVSVSAFSLRSGVFGFVPLIGLLCSRFGNLCLVFLGPRVTWSMGLLCSRFGRLCLVFLRPRVTRPFAIFRIKMQNRSVFN